MKFSLESAAGFCNSMIFESLAGDNGGIVPLFAFDSWGEQRKMSQSPKEGVILFWRTRTKSRQAATIHCDGRFATTTVLDKM
jgi:hypothetical protein